MNSIKLKTVSVIISAAVITGCLTGCGGISQSDFKRLEERVEQLESKIGSSANSSKNSPAETPSKSSNASNEDFDENKVYDEIKVTQHDFVDNDDNKYSIFVFNNTSDFNVDAMIKITTNDEDGEILQEEEKTIKGLPKGKESYASFALDEDTETIVRTVTYEENTEKENPLDNLSARAAKAEGGANVTIRNNGTSAVKNLKYMTLFFKGKELVGFDNGNVPNISASSSEVIPSEYYGSFDKAEVYITR